MPPRRHQRPATGWLVALIASSCLGACAISPPLQVQIASALAAPELAGTRWGLMAATLDGDVIAAIRPDDRFVPASNTKIFTTAAAFARMGDVAMPDPASGVSLRLAPRPDGGPPDLILVGGGDATLADRPDCRRNCLSYLAEFVIQNRLERIGAIIADDTLFPDERWGPGWSWNNLQTRSGTAVSALVVNDNEIALEVWPGAQPGEPAAAAWRPGDDIYPLQNDTVTLAEGDTRLRIERLPGANTVRLYGEIAAASPVQTVRIGVEDPAVAAALRLKRLLEAEGIVVEGEVVARRRPVALADDPALRGETPAPRTTREGLEIGRILPEPLLDSLRLISKDSQNLHSEVLLRRLGLIEGAGSSADGLAIVEAMLREAGAPREGWDIADGSGMSTYNRVSPRAMTRFLIWTAQQPWGEAWRETLPVGGVDGTLARRFRGTELEGRIFAKTGTLNATNALSGFMIAQSGRLVVFSVFANDRPWEAPTATQAMDAALLAIARAN